MAIKLIEGSYASFFPREMDAMFRHRAATFDERLGWVKAENGIERDKFDDCNPLYLVSVDANDEHQGSLRLLPTTGPNMLRDVFPQLMGITDTDGYTIYGDFIESATIWECSRICVAPGRKDALDELLIGIAEVAVIAGLTQVVSVFDAMMLRLLRTRLDIHIVGTPQRIGGVMTYAGLFDCGTDSEVKAWSLKFGHRWSVLAPGAKEMAFS